MGGSVGRSSGTAGRAPERAPASAYSKTLCVYSTTPSPCMIVLSAWNDPNHESLRDARDAVDAQAHADDDWVVIESAQSGHGFFAVLACRPVV